DLMHLQCTGVFVAALTIALACVGAGTQKPARTPAQPGCTLHWWPDPANRNTFIVEASGLGASALEELRQADWTLSKWQRLLRVQAEEGDAATNIWATSMLGAYRIAGETLLFEPQFPLVPGVVDRAVFAPNQLPGARGTGGKLVTANYRLAPRVSTPKTVVSQVYPTASVLPENLLK